MTVTINTCSASSKIICHISCLVVTARKRNWGKVIFSEACVKNSVHRGVPAPGGSGPGGRGKGACFWGVPAPGGACSGECLLPGGSGPGVWSRGVCSRRGLVPGEGACSWGVPAPGGCIPPAAVAIWGVPALGDVWWKSPRAATAAGGTHPTGMHSCFSYFFLNVVESLKQNQITFQEETSKEAFCA